MKLLVIGNITIDKIYRVNQFPKPGETILTQKKRVNLGGKGLNQSIIAARSGLEKVEFISSIGERNKNQNKKVQSYLKENNVKSKLMKKNDYTDESIILTNQQGENIIISTDKVTKKIKPKDVNPHLEKLKSQDGVLLQGNLSKNTTEYCIKKAHEKNAEIIINLAPAEYKLKKVWDKIGYLIVNEEESKTLTGKSYPKEAIKYLISESVKNVIITLGSKGVIYATEKDTQIEKISSPNVKVIDTTGAGDTFAGVFTAGLFMFSNIKASCKWAVRAASITVTREGTSQAFPSKKEIYKLRGD